jgi:hypothetical protein
MSTAKKIKAVLGFMKVPDVDLLKAANTVHDSLLGNASYATPPVDLAALKTEIDTLTTLVTDAEDGGKRAISAKNKQRHVVIKMLTQLGHYVEAACNDDLATFNTSGFVQAAATTTPAGPLSQSAFKYIDRGPNSGQIEIKPLPQSGVLLFEVQYAVVTKGTPGAWDSLQLTNSKATVISGLTPGATYAFQIRAVGKLGYNDWSDSTTFICA